MNRRAGLTGQHARMADVAKRAGVSAMSVSRALKTPSAVSPEIRQRVEHAVRAVGYVPNELAGGLRAFSRTKLVAAIVPSLRDSLFAAQIQGMSDALRARGYKLMVGDSHYSPAEQTELVSAFLAQRPSGCVLHDPVSSPQTARLLLRSGIPIVEVGDLARRPLDMVVSYSNFAAGKAMTRHLIDRAYRRIGFVSLNRSITQRSVERFKGYKAALREARLPVNPRHVIEVEGGYASGGAVIVELVKQGADAAFFAGGVMALGAALQCQRRGWAVPGRIAIAMFDDHEVASQLSPAITALKIPRYEIGQRTAELILARHEGTQNKSVSIDLGFEIVARAST